MWLRPQPNMQHPARFRPQQYNSPDLVRRPDTAEPTSRALYFVSPCNVQRRSTKSADPALRNYYPYCFSQLVCMFPTLHGTVLEEERSNRGGDLIGSERDVKAAGRQCSVTREISAIEISAPVPLKVEKMWRAQTFVFRCHKGSARVLTPASNASHGHAGADSGLIFRVTLVVHNLPDHSNLDA
ncbi:uncharacterized protein EAF02_008526 [Botrytis sinoallii]|uniref:uncharacterized protein n=1 Tax=Botrytis sinoallii TaxID=1463999 RepID=UPI0018FF5090|nr:uncharacterized protein EAF02_008526 [Botrytis sinoallii]KAF7874549.1 hypothetical protein EAF02_008526 [Botrytis sinoallii]